MWLAAAALLLSGCAGRYFHAEPPPAQAEPRYTLAEWPYHEYWTGLVFNGAKIGFTHWSLSREPGGEYRVDSEAALRLHFLDFDKRVQLRASDWIGDDLTLLRFEYDYLLDQSRLQLSGSLRGGELAVTIHTGGATRSQSLTVNEPLYPAAAIGMLPVYRGLAVGAAHRFLVYDGETQALATVDQAIVGYETSALFPGPAYKVETSMYGKTVQSWLGSDGLPVLETSLNGVLIADLESEARARLYLANAALNKQDVLLDFSRVAVDRPIAQPRTVHLLRLRLQGVPGDFPLRADTPNQQCRSATGALECTIRSDAAAGGAPAVVQPRDRLATLTSPSDDPRLAQAAREITAGAQSPREQITRLLQWLAVNIDKVPADSYSALDVFEQRAAECQGHSYLYTAFARALNIPTRVVNGLVYSAEHDAFLYHTWVESYVGQSWLPVDPTFAQAPADATHVALLDGESSAELAPLTTLLGALRAQVLVVQ